MANLIDINQLTQDKVDEILEYLQEGPIDLSEVIFHDELYELAYQSIMDDLIAEAEARVTEAKEEGYFDDED